MNTLATLSGTTPECHWLVDEAVAALELAAARLLGAHEICGTAPIEPAALARIQSRLLTAMAAVGDAQAALDAAK